LNSLKMPRSKRDKEVSLTVVKKKGRDGKEKLVEEVRRCIDEYKSALVFSVESFRTVQMNQVRHVFKENSRFFFGRNKVLAIALGRIPSEEYKRNLCKLSSALVGQRGLMFSNLSVDDIIRDLKKLEQPEFARSGNKATETVTISAGPLGQFQFTIEPLLRKLGLPVKLEKGVVMMEQDFVVCKKDCILTPEQAKILELFGIRLAKFKLNPILAWYDDGTVRKVSKQKKL
ncbi:mRNA turnover protein 4 -like protein, partial [Trichinella pseudospiralis]